MIEILVVVSIVGILAALLLPAISLVQTQARLTQCRSNMRICTLAVIAYTSDTEGVLPYRDSQGETGSGGPFWANRTSSYLDDVYQKTLYSGNNVYHCPLAEREIPNKWMSPDRFSFHFGMNRNLYASWDSSYGAWVGGIRPVHLNGVRSQAVLLSDGKIGLYSAMSYFWDYTAIDAIAGSDPSLPWPVTPPSSPPPLTPLPITLHGRSVSCSHVDGHISSINGTFDRVEQTKEWMR